MNQHLYPPVDLTINNLVENSSTVIDLYGQNAKLNQSNRTLFFIVTGLCIAIVITVVVIADKRANEDERS